jgi:hypothetical protein
VKIGNGKESWLGINKITDLKEYKSLPVTDFEDAKDSQTSRLPRFLDTRLIDGDEIISVMHQPSLYPQEDSWY